jgi:hypothetical protein
LSWEFQHVFKTLRKVDITGLFVPITAHGEQFVKNIPAMVRVVGELEEKGCQQATDVALRGITEVEVMVRDQGRTNLAHVLDVLDNGGAY